MVLPGIGEILIMFLICYYFLSGWIMLMIAAGIGTMIYLYSNKKQSVWRTLNVPGPAPWPVLGNCDRFKTGNHTYALENGAKYGKIFGSYVFMSPELFVSELDVLRNVLVKDFEYFTNRRTFRPKDFGERPNPSLFDVVVSVLPDQKWKNVRNMMTPTFTAGKIKLSIPLIQQAVDTFVEVLSEKCDKGEPINVKECYGCFTMDVIAAVAFGTQVDSQRNPDDPLVAYAKESFSFSIKSPLIWFALMFPLTVNIMKERLGITLLFAKGQEFFLRTIGKLLAERRANPKSPPDFLQLMINANNDQEATVMHEDGSKGKSLSEFELIGQLMIFLLAGYDTTATTLQFLSYLFAVNPEHQERCYAEVVEAFGEKETLSYDDLQHKLDYLEACICETLRMYSPVTQFDRITSKPYNLNGITIPEDVGMVVPVHAIHYSEEHYPEPYKFDPDRFMPEERKARDPLTFLPFGYGPRNCIGMRFAMIEMKLCVAMLLRKFQFAKCPKTEVPLEIDSTGMILKPKKPLFLELKLR